MTFNKWWKKKEKIISFRNIEWEKIFCTVFQATLSVIHHKKKKNFLFQNRNVSVNFKLFYFIIKKNIHILREFPIQIQEYKKESMIYILYLKNWWMIFNFVQQSLQPPKRKWSMYYIIFNASIQNPWCITFFNFTKKFFILWLIDIFPIEK